jgi:hypothetical protein
VIERTRLFGAKLSVRRGRGAPRARHALALALLALAACGVDQPERLQPPLAADAARHPVATRPRAEVPGAGLRTGRRDHAGAEVRAPCGSCHADTGAADLRRASAEDLDEAHAGLQLVHGGLRCGQCHGADRPDGARDLDRLRLADGSGVGFDAVMRLCEQCHGPQARDYQRGAHGGMTGHWDLRLGPRQRNQCVHCHDPHAPAFPAVAPLPRARDRFLRGATGGHGAAPGGA